MTSAASAPDPHPLARFRSYPVRRVTYAEAETVAKRLAARLVAEIGADEVRRSRYVPLPRGGLFVLGMLSYILDLRPDLLNAEPSGDRLIIVDDVAYSGGRFADFLRSRSEERIVFAHLFSVPALREAITAAEPRVEACVAGSDLEDTSGERFENAADYEAWREMWAARVGGTRYWMGGSEHLVLPWSEPKFVTWNEESQSFDYGWRQGSPDACLANWGSLGVDIKEPGTRHFGIPTPVAYRFDDDTIQLCDLRTGTVSAVQGVAADMWRGFAAYGNIDQTVELLLDTYDVDPDRLRSDARDFAEELVRNGLLEPSSDAGP